MPLFITRVNQKLGDLLITFLPLCIGMMLLRLPEFFHAFTAQINVSEAVGIMLLNDLLALLKGSFLWFVLAAPCLLISKAWIRSLCFSTLSSLILIFEAGLIHYYQVSGVPLGADLFAYTFHELWAAGSSSAFSFPLNITLALIFGIVLNWIFPILKKRITWLSFNSKIPLVFFLVIASSFLLLPTHTSASDETLRIGFQRKIVFFIENSFAKMSVIDGFAINYAGSEHPFAHSETTPDTLGKLIALSTDQKPHFVFIIVEGLGRSFSGTPSRLGSFTPFLDSLANRSLYWENFLASQGRTFAVLPSIFGSLPFGSYGQNFLKHDSLLSLLKNEGYLLQYFTGSNLDFDQQGRYLSLEGVESMVSEVDFSDTARKVSEWGYADLDLMKMLASKTEIKKNSPTLTIVQTMSMHTPFKFPEIDEYRKKVDLQLSLLKVPENLQEAYLKQRDIYASVLYTDESIKKYFLAMENTPDWRNTIVVITGDHRLPEIPMQTRIERYHVPLLIASPMIQEPKRIKSISSHFDIAPTILAMLSNRYQMKTPSTVNWIGTGLDVHEDFRNLHRFPIKQTKTELSDYVSGQYFLGQDQLYKINDGLQIEPIDNLQIKTSLISEFKDFQSSLRFLSQAKNLTPNQSVSDWRSYDPATRSLTSRTAVAEFQGVAVSGTQAFLKDDGYLHVRAAFKFNGKNQSPIFVPLIVMTNKAGNELGEAYGSSLQLQPGEMKEVELKLKLADKRLIHGDYFVAAIVSHPDTGKSIGQGEYHVEIKK